MKETKFKQTEVGLIPSDWEVKTVKCIAPLQRGFDLPTAMLRDGNVPVVYSNGICNFHNKSKCIGPGLVTGRSGTIGKFTFIASGPYWPHNTSLWVTSFKGNNPLFVYYLYSSLKIEDFSGGSGVPTLNRNNVHEKMVAVPSSIEEQKHIAQALSDVDAVISITEKLIAKKKALKQGTKQTLLCGKMRIQNDKWIKTTHFKQTELGPIPQEWEVEKLSQICDKFLDGDWIEADDQSSEGIRLIQTGNIGNGQYLDKANRKHFISEATFKRLNCTEIFEGDVLVSRLPDPVGRACILPKSHERRITAVDCTIIRFSNYNPILFVHYTQTSVYQNAVNECLSGSTRLRISRKNLGEMLIPVPPTKEEQTAIATVLSDMDSEIAALETKLAKYRQLKTGMMQQLLTGKIRLAI